ncbi:hypothetical protein TNCV_1499491 [Trichonephila clavipes]|nr:hypothetical protein TNCV_1499491 [Trichonephila clavipes]
MNSPDYNDLVDMFNLSTPVSPLPSTPVASPSHDGTQSMVSLEPLRDSPQIPVKIDSQRRSRERRPRDPRRRRPPYAHRFPQAKAFFHIQGLSVLCLRDHGFTLTNSVVSYALDRGCPKKLFQYLH